MSKLFVHISLLAVYLSPIFIHGQTNYITVFSDYEYKVFKDISFQKIDTFDILLASSASINESKAQKFRKQVDDFIRQYSHMKQRRSDMSVIRKVYCHIYRTFLKDYQQYATLGDVFEHGTYDCLSGTILFTYILSALGYEVRAIETNYHVYLKVILDKREILIESTDPFYGFIIGKKAIIRREKTYLNANIPSPRSIAHFQTRLNIQNKVNLKQLAGLQYYNKAVECFNMGKREKAILYLKKSSYLYHSERQKELLSKFNINHTLSSAKRAY